MHLPRSGCHHDGVLVAAAAVIISLATLGVSLTFLGFSESSSILGLRILTPAIMPSVTRWVCMGCQQPNRFGGPSSYFADYKSAACHYARSPVCNKSNRGLRTLTIVSRPSDRDAGGGGAAGNWPPQRAQHQGITLPVM